jgi:hypothetical protein
MVKDELEGEQESPSLLTTSRTVWPIVTGTKGTSRRQGTG